MIRRTILEWQTISYGEAADEIPVQAADRIAAIAAASPLAGRGGGGVLEYGRKQLRARGVVGVIAAEGCAIEILPKIDFPGEDGPEMTGSIRRRLVHMLAVALDLKIDAGQVTTLDWQQETLLEILIRLFSEKLVDAVRQGMPRRYVEHADDLPVLRGGLDVTRQFTILAAEPSRLACRYDSLTADTALNRIMKAAVARLVRIARTADNRRRLRELAFAYADISDVPISVLRWDEVVLDRTNSRWRELLNLARLLLGERFQTTSAGSSDGFSLLFEMNTLFEEYVARMLKCALVDTDLRAVSQGGRLYCLETEDRRGLFQTRPDILVKRGDEVVQIIDTKWKRIAASIDDARQGVSQGDVYQMMAYGQLYKCDRLTLLYPHHAAVKNSEGVHAVHQVTGCSNWLQTATIDIGRSEMLSERLRAITDF
ncbi:MULTISPECIES: restriction endonuclease [unclassified Mesorhizobium]|uniref:McrC family protein n=1 Tax=unclassified Mesorhizobium TaxID=325217 RepID=UPI0010938E6D|nr:MULTISPECIES: restriction endonuclease [unclassified Mesorhizobium]TGT35906.1 restriction endonuclease [Mesorhizobium sp. M8A.F.Ca.ET.165.01.1.1]TIS47399.1 MAG: restriction endonuclease [Mesorhizobium sp.]